MQSADSIVFAEALIAAGLFPQADDIPARLRSFTIDSLQRRCSNDPLRDAKFVEKYLTAVCEGDWGLAWAVWDVIMSIPSPSGPVTPQKSAKDEADDTMSSRLTRLTTSFPQVDDPTIRETLLRAEGNEDRATRFLQHLQEFYRDEPLAEGESAPRRKRSVALSAGSQVKGPRSRDERESPTVNEKPTAGPVNQPREPEQPHTPQLDQASLRKRVAVVTKKLKASRDFGGKDPSLLAASSETLSNPDAYFKYYFPEDALQRHYAAPDYIPKHMDVKNAVLQHPDLLRGVSPEDFQEKFASLWPVKLILTSLRLNPLQKIAGNLIYRTWKWGMVHAAIQIGPIVLDWGPSSLVIPQPLVDFAQEGTLLALDVGRLDPNVVDGDRFVSRDKLMRVCERVCEWNTQCVYSVVSKNCQDFVNEIFDALGLQPALDGELHTFIKSLSGGDEHDVSFKFRGNTFASHTQLDRFVLENEATLSPQEYNLLKAFDRAFWLRYFAYEEKMDELSDAENLLFVRAAPAKNDNDVACCPFNNPRSSGTMAFHTLS